MKELKVKDLPHIINTLLLLICETLKVTTNPEDSVEDVILYKLKYKGGLWFEVAYGNYEPFYDYYGIKDANEPTFPRIMKVWEKEKHKYTEIVIGQDSRGRYVSIDGVVSLDEIKGDHTHFLLKWRHAREITPKTQVSMKAIAEWQGTTVDNIEIVE